MNYDPLAIPLILQQFESILQQANVKNKYGSHWQARTAFTCTDHPRMRSYCPAVWYTPVRCWYRLYSVDTANVA